MKSSSIFFSLSLLFAVAVLSSAAPFSSPYSTSLFKRDDNDGWNKGAAHVIPENNPSTQNIPSTPIIRRDESQSKSGSTPNLPSTPGSTNIKAPTQDTKDTKDAATNPKNSPIQGTNPNQDTKNTAAQNTQKTPATPKTSAAQNSPAAPNNPATTNTPSLANSDNPLDNLADRKKKTTDTKSSNSTNVHTTYYEADQLKNAACYGRDGIKPYNAKPSDSIAAIPMTNFNMCFQCAEVKNVATGKSIIVKFIDECAGCDPGCIDLTKSAFSQLADPNCGVINIAWRTTTCPSDGNWPNYEHEKSS
ncbi:1759_t:CDS:2, partial [Gigaspora margarita]